MKRRRTSFPSSSSRSSSPDPFRPFKRLKCFRQYSAPAGVTSAGVTSAPYDSENELVLAEEPQELPTLPQSFDVLGLSDSVAAMNLGVDGSSAASSGPHVRFTQDPATIIPLPPSEMSLDSPVNTFDSDPAASLSDSSCPTPKTPATTRYLRRADENNNEIRSDPVVGNPKTHIYDEENEENEPGNEVPHGSNSPGNGGSDADAW